MTSIPRARTGNDQDRAAVPPCRVVVADDHRSFADLLKVALDAEPDFECVGATYDLDAAYQLVSESRPDTLIIDRHFEGDDRDGCDAAAALIRRFPDLRVLVLTAFADGDLMRRAATAGVCSLLPKDGSLPELLTALRSARPGGLVVHPTLLRSLVSDKRPAPTYHLSRREEGVLELLAQGRDVRSIAKELGISVNTCRGYVKSLLAKLDAHSQLEAVAIARRHGLASAEQAG